jgi:hypothetical protein
VFHSFTFSFNDVIGRERRRHVPPSGALITTHGGPMYLGIGSGERGLWSLVAKHCGLFAVRPGDCQRVAIVRQMMVVDRSSDLWY